jgi:hypothetical protein
MKKNNDFIELESNSKRFRVEIDLTNLLEDPSLRKIKCDYHPSDKNQIRKKKTAYQPFNHGFLRKEFEKTMCCFNSA